MDGYDVLNAGRGAAVRAGDQLLERAGDHLLERAGASGG